MDTLSFIASSGVGSTIYSDYKNCANSKIQFLVAVAYGIWAKSENLYKSKGKYDKSNILDKMADFCPECVDLARPKSLGTYHVITAHQQSLCVSIYWYKARIAPKKLKINILFPHRLNKPLRISSELSNRMDILCIKFCLIYQEKKRSILNQKIYFIYCGTDIVLLYNIPTQPTILNSRVVGGRFF